MNYLQNMENMKRLDNSEQSKLSEKYTIYKTTYKGDYKKEDFLKRIKQNDSLYYDETFEYPNSIYVEIECDEFKSVDNQTLDFLREKISHPIDKYARCSWIYTQVPDFTMEWMHTHDWLESSNRTILKTQWTYVFYIQIPPNLKEGEGDLIFKTEDDVLHVFTPKENDIIIFPGDLPHMPIPTIGSEINRICYTTNINYDFNYTRETNKRIQFKDHIKMKNGEISLLNQKHIN